MNLIEAAKPSVSKLFQFHFPILHYSIKQLSTKSSIYYNNKIFSLTQIALLSNK